MRLLSRFLLLFALATVLGCTSFHPQRNRSPLKTAQMSRDSIVLDVFFIRCPFDDPLVNEALWREIDEQQISLDVRQRLADNGFRVGVIGGQIPIGLSRLLQLKDRPAPTIGSAAATSVADIGSEEGPMWSHKQLRAGKRSEIVTSDVYEELPVLLRDGDEVSGRTYRKAQGVMAVRAVPESDGRILLEIAPELHHGDMQRNFSGSQGAWRMDMARPRRVFDDMVILTHLTPGHMVVLSSLASRPGSLGHHFLTTDSSSSLEQKLLVIRLSQTQHDALFESQPLALDEVE